MLPDPETCRRLARDVAPRWKWLAGMAFTTRMERGRIDFVNSDGDSYFTVAGKLVRAHDSTLPDLADPLTAAGALLVARQVWGLHDLGPLYFGPLTGYTGGLTKRTIEGGYWGLSVGARFFRGATELEVIIAAILAAPEK